MVELPQDGIVYYIDGRQFVAGRIKKEIEKVDKRIADTKEELALLATAEKALGRVEGILREMRGLAVKAAGGGPVDRERLNAEFQGLKREADKVIREASYKGINLLDGTFGDIEGIIAAIKEAMG